jgi:hypothetical protein
MFKDKPTCFLGTKFNWAYPMSKKDMRKLVDRALPGMKYQWSPRKNTQIAVLGDNPPAAQVDAAREAGLEVLEFQQWLGLDVAAEADSVAGYLGAVTAAGFRVTTRCNEGDGGMDVVSLKLVPFSDQPAVSTERLEKMASFAKSDLHRDVQNTLVDWVRQNKGEWLAPRAYASRHRDMRSFYAPDHDEKAGFWIKDTASIGASDHGSLLADSESRTLPIQILEQRLADTGAGKVHTFCVAFTDAPVADTARTLILLGCLEKDKTRVSFVPIPVVHT